MRIGIRVKYPLFLSYFKENQIFATDFRKILKFQISWKSVLWEPSCSMRTDRHDEGKSRFSQFCESAQLNEGRLTGLVTYCLRTAFEIK